MHISFWGSSRLATLRGMVLLAAALALAVPSGLRAQQMEPRSYANAPIGLNFLVAAYQYAWGDVLFDPSVPIKNADAKVNGVVLGYSRVLDFWGESGTLAVALPYAWISGSGLVEGQAESVHRSGFGDLGLRLSVNLIGAPALSLQEFRAYRQDTIVGASLAITAPTGQYDPPKLVNVGTNRWSFAPQVGVSKALGQWILEGTMGVTFFTDNNEFLGNKVRQQDPLYAVQAHVIYNFSPALWGALDWTYYFGGRTTVNGILGEDLQSNSRWGATLAQSLDKYNSIKFYFNAGAYARTGTDFTTIGIAWQYRWGAGL